MTKSIKEDYLFFINHIRAKSYKGNVELARKLSEMWDVIILSLKKVLTDPYTCECYLTQSIGLSDEDALFIVQTIPDDLIRIRVRMEWHNIDNNVDTHHQID